MQLPEYKPMSQGAFRFTLDIRSTTDLYCWCRSYSMHFRESDNVDALTRFNIGQYQYAQAIQWKQQPETRYESLASVVIHVLGAAGMEKTDDVLTLLPASVDLYPHGPCDSEEMLFSMTSLVQMYFYARKRSVGYIRATRVNPQVIATHTARIVSRCIGMIPLHHYDAAMEQAIAQLVQREFAK